MTASDLSTFDDQTFDENVLAAEGLVLVEFWNDGCIPCRHLQKLLVRLSDEITPTVQIGTVNIDENPALAERYGIRAVPALFFFKNGEVVETRSGVDRRQVIKKLAATHA